MFKNRVFYFSLLLVWNGICIITSGGEQFGTVLTQSQINHGACPVKMTGQKIPAIDVPQLNTKTITNSYSFFTTNVAVQTTITKINRY
jgi:hypothetical protein